MAITNTTTSNNTLSNAHADFNITPADYFQLIFREVSETGNVKMPALSYGFLDDEEFATESEDHFYDVQLNWTEEDKKAYFDEFSNVVNSIEEIAKLYTDYENMDGAYSALPESLHEVWSKYIAKIITRDELMEKNPQNIEGKYATAELTYFGWRLWSLFCIDAPKVIINNEKINLLISMLLNKYATTVSYLQKGSLPIV